MIFTTTFLKDAAERAVKAFLATFIALITASGIGTTGVDILAVGQKAALGGVAAALSILFSAVSTQVGAPTASLVNTTPPAPPKHAITDPAPPILGDPPAANIPPAVDLSAVDPGVGAHDSAIPPGVDTTPHA